MEGRWNDGRTGRVGAKDLSHPLLQGTSLSCWYSVSDMWSKRGRECTGEEESEKMRTSGPAAACAAALFPAGAGNEEIGSHQNMQALSSQAHLS